MENVSYMPVDQTVMEMIENEAMKGNCRLFYFGNGTDIEEVEGNVTGMKSKNGFEYFLFFENGEKVRIDRIISYNLKPGPAYDEYDAYGLQCLTCQAGYDFDDD